MATNNKFWYCVEGHVFSHGKRKPGPGRLLGHILAEDGQTARKRIGKMLSHDIDFVMIRFCSAHKRNIGLTEADKNQMTTVIHVPPDKR